MVALHSSSSRQAFGFPGLFCTAFFSSLLTLGVISSWPRDNFSLVTGIPAASNWCSPYVPDEVTTNALGVVDEEQIVSEPKISESLTSPELVGLPTPSFRDNLRNGTSYITSIFDTGWTNEVMVYGNLIYLGLLTQRVPILPPFAPSHIGHNQRLVPFGEVFDVPRLSKAIHVPLVEWHEVKDVESTHDDSLGCWSVWETAHSSNGVRSPIYSWMMRPMHVDISYTHVPQWAVLGYGELATYWKLAKLSNPDIRQQSLGTPHPSPNTGIVQHPGQQVLCYDMLYFTTSDEPGEYDNEFSPVWHTIMKHAHFTPQLEALADVYLRTVFDLGGDEPIPLFITIHARHGDFSAQCSGLPKDQCFTPLDVWQEHAAELRAKLRAEKGVDVQHIIVTSDEQDEAWWDAVTARGWYRVDHEKMRTEEVFSKWYPIFIDVAIQARSKGFLGTQGSTLSLLALRRVHDWHDGLGKLIPWNQFGQHPETLQIH